MSSPGSRRLVGQDHHWVGDDRPCYRDALLRFTKRDCGHNPRVSKRFQLDRSDCRDLRPVPRRPPCSCLRVPRSGTGCRAGAQRVLELAAGTGILTMELARLLPNARITATDLNPAMVSWRRTASRTSTGAGGRATPGLPRGLVRAGRLPVRGDVLPGQATGHRRSGAVLVPGGTMLSRSGTS